MAKKDIKFTLDTIDSRYSPVGTVKQLDSVFFYIKITENGVTKDLTGQTIKLFAIKEDKKIVEQTTKINITNQREGLVEIELLNAAIQVHGFTYFELEISDSNGIISTSDFILRVNKRVGSDEAIESTNEVSTLKEIEVYVAQAKQEIKEFKKLQNEMLKTNETINVNEVARVEAENSRVAAESARVESDKLRDEKVTEFGKQVAKNMKETKIINNNLNKIDANLVLFNPELKNNAQWLGNKLTIPPGNAGGGTKITYKVENFKNEINQFVYFVFKLKRNKQLGAFGFQLIATRGNKVVGIPLEESKTEFLETTNEILFINKFKILKGDYDFKPIIIFTNEVAADDEVQFTFEDVSLKQEIHSKFKETENEIFNKNIYHNFTNVANEKAEVLNGAIKINNNKFEIPIGGTGNTSYIGADLYLTGTNTRIIRIYSVVSISNLDTFSFENIKYDIFIPNSIGGYDNITPQTNYLKISDNVAILCCDYDYKGTEEYLKTRVQLKNLNTVNTNTTIYAGGFCYTFEKSKSGTLNKAFTDSIQVLINKSIEKIEIPTLPTNTKELLFNGVNSRFNTVTKTINTDVYFEIAENYNTTLRVFGIKNRKEYLLPLTNLSTGTTSKEAVYCSKYKVFSDGYTEFKFERNPSSSDFGEMIAYLISPCGTVPLKDTRKYNTIDKAKIKNDEKTCIGISTYGIRNGKMLGTKINNGTVEVLESDINYGNFVKVGELPNSTEHPSHVEICGDNSVIFISRTGKVYRTTDLVNYSEVLDIKDNIYAWGGFTQLDAVDNVVLVSEYRLPAKHQLPWEQTDGGGKLYFSENYGETFKAVFDLPINDPDGALGTHIHAVKYDPYENIIWIVTGDGIGNQMIWYSLDKGTNWYQSTEFRENAIQMTSIYPLRNCVLFGSDGRLVGVARYNRPECGTMAGVKMNFDYPIILAEGWGKSGGTNVPVASRGAIDYKNSKVYFGFLGAPYIHEENKYGILKNGEIWASDGYTTELIFKSKTEIDYGVIAVYEDFSNNKAIGKLGREGKFVEIKSDIWI